MKRPCLLFFLSALATLTSASASSVAWAKGVETGAKASGASGAGEPRTKASAGSRGEALSGPMRSSAPARQAGSPTSARSAAGRPPAQAAHGPMGASSRAATASSAGKLRAKSKGAQPCYARPVQLVRARGSVLEPYELSLTLCNGAPNRSVLDTLSIVARPRDVELPTAAELRAYRALPLARGKGKRSGKGKFRDPAFVSERIMRLHPGLLLRLQRIANRYRGRPIEVVSGYRPDARFSSRHHHGRALDLRVAGVSRERLRDFLRHFEQTGVGYYPNSFFVHMDVRDAKGYWVDRSGPGEPADYGPWPPRKQDMKRSRERLVRNALAELSELRR